MLYRPEPIIFENEELPETILKYMDWIGEQVHERWAANRIRDGWEYGPEYDGKNRKHPCLIPYAQLPESEKEYDKSTAKHTIQLLLSAGFQIIPPEDQ